MKGRLSTPLQRRAWRAILVHAITRIESAVTLALAIILVGLLPRPFSFWRWWYWLILFGLAEVLIIYTSITDEQAAAAAVAELLRQRFSPSALRDKALQARLEQALQYRQAMELQVRRRRQGPMRERLAEVTQRVDEWLAGIYGLAQRLDQLRADSLLQRDMKAVPQQLRRYEERLGAEATEATRKELMEALASKREQLGNLMALSEAMERAELQLENTISKLGTMYSQMLLIEAQGAESGRMQRLSQDISEQVASLSDLVATLDELYARSSRH